MLGTGGLQRGIAAQATRKRLVIQIDREAAAEFPYTLVDGIAPQQHHRIHGMTVFSQLAVPSNQPAPLLQCQLQEFTIAGPRIRDTGIVTGGTEPAAHALQHLIT